MVQMIRLTIRSLSCHDITIITSELIHLKTLNDLTFSHVTAGGKGSQAGILIGEQILEINGNSTKDLVHVAAQKLIKSTGDTLTLTLDKSSGSSPVTSTTSSITQQPAKGND